MLTIHRRWFKALCFLFVFIFSSTCFSNITPFIAYAAQESTEQEESTDSMAQELSVEQTAEISKADASAEPSDAPVQTAALIAEPEAMVSQDGRPVQTDSRLLETGEQLGAISVKDFGSQYFPEDRKPSAEEYQSLYTEKTEDENGNGTIEFYFSPIRYQDEDGKWKRIDTSLVKTDIGYSTRSTEAAVALSENGSSSSLASIEKNGNSVSFRPIDSLEENVQTARLIQPNGKTVKASSFNSEQAYFGVRHNNIFSENTDMILLPSSNGVKEEIILNKPADIDEFSFELTLSGMYPILRSDGNLFFIDEDTDKVEAYIPAPFMYDSAEEQQESYEVDVRVEKKSERKYIYTLIPDKEWLADSRRVYPVVVDPSFTFRDATMYETFISKKYPTENYFTDTHVKVGNSDALGVSRGLYGILQFKSSIGTNRYISSATFKAYQDYTGASSPAIGLYQVNKSYNNENVTWNTRPTISTSAAATKTVQATGWYEWNITAMVRNWYSGAVNWARFCMRNTNEDANMYKRFRSDNYGDGTTYSPRLVVSYVTAPSVPTASVSPAPPTWTNGNITLSWSGVTPGSGATLADVQYSVTSATAGYISLGASASGSKVLANLPTGANHSLWVRAKNSVGLYSTAKALSYSRDAQAPNAPTSVTLSPASWTSGNITVSYSGASDDLSGISYHQYGISSSASAAPSSSSYTTVQQSPFTIAPTQSSGYVWVRAVDKAGNVGTAKCSSTPFYRDTSAPPAPASVTISPASWTKGSIGVTFQAVTDASGISKYQYALTSSNTAPAASAYVNTPALTGSTFYITPAEGQQYVWVRAVNGVNMASAGTRSSTKYLRDTTPPAAPSTVKLVYSDGAADSKTLMWDGVSDALSGVAKLEYRIDSGAYITIPVENNNFASGQITFTSASENVTLRITDGAGNTREISASPEIAVPNGFTATSMVNHAVKLMWQGSATAGVVYDVYKAIGNGEFTKVAEGLTGNYWFDYNIENGTSYSYKMRATLTRNGETLESADTAEETATPVSADILSIQLGQRSYETLLSYDITSGTGAVHPLSGNLLYRKEDVNTNSAAHPISFTRTYNSLGGYVSPFGTNWDHSLNIMLLKTFDSTGAETGVLYKAGDGAIYTFSKNADGTYTRPAGLYAELTINSDGLYTLTYKDKTVYTFNESNQIASISDNIGDTTEFVYNARGNLISVSNSLGDELTLAYYTTPGKADLIERVTAGGVTCDYVYDDNKRLIKAQKPVENSNNWITEEYTYYENGMLNKVLTAVDGEYLFAYGEGGKAESVTDPQRRRFDVTYQTEGASYIVTSSFAGKTISQTYSADMKMTSLSDNGRVTSYTYDADFNVTSTTAPGNITTSATYDSRGNVLTATNEMGKAINYTYADGKDVPSSVSEPWNGSTRKVTRYTYNAKDLPTTVCVEGSRQKTFHYYDSSWNLIKTVTATGDGAEALSREAAENITAGNGLFVTITEYEYDSARRVVKTTRKDGDKTRISTQSYDNATNQVTQEVSDGVTAEYEYTIKSVEPQLVMVRAGNNVTTSTTEFDHMGNATSETDAMGNISTTVYDDLGRVIKETAADGIVTETVYGDKSDGTSYTLVTVKNGSDIQKKSLTVTDKWGNTILEGTCRVNGDESGISYETSAGTVVLIDYTENTYDAAGRLTSSTDRYGMTTSNTYDAAGRVLTETLSKGENSETTAYTYDDAGNRLTETLPDGTTTTYTYDVLGRVLTETVSKGSDSLTQTAYTYDIVDGTQLRRELRDAKNRVISWKDNAFGELAEEKRGTATTAYEYDADGQLIKSTLTDASKPGESAVTEYEYTGVNQTKKKYSPNHYIEYVYDENGKVTEERVTKDGGASWQAITNVYDNANGNVTSTTRSGETLTFGYSGDKQLRDTVTYGTGDVVKYVYNDRGDITAVKLNDVLTREYLYTSGHVSEIRDYTAANTYTSQTFAYDWKGRVTAVSYKNTAGAEQEGYTLAYGDGDRIAAETTTYRYTDVPVTVSKAYEYDWLGRLTKETANGTVTTYSYDAVGNRTGMTSGGATLVYTYDDGDRLLNVKQGENVVSSYTYDVSGNRTSAAENGVTTDYTYDAANQLVKAQRGAAVLGEYTYDAEGQRLTKTVNGTTLSYVYDGIDLLYAKEGDTVTEKNLLEDDGSMILSCRGTVPYWYRQDIRGSVTNIIDGGGTVQKSYTYDAYGNTGTGDNAAAIENHHAYTGAYMDGETGLYYLSSRYYDPKTGSFTSADSYRGESEQFWQLYAYCEGDPVNGTDLTGHSTSYIGKRHSDGNVSVDYSIYYEERTVQENPCVSVDIIKMKKVAVKIYRKNKKVTFINKLTFTATTTGVEEKIVGNRWRSTYFQTRKKKYVKNNPKIGISYTSNDSLNMHYVDTANFKLELKVSVFYCYKRDIRRRIIRGITYSPPLLYLGEASLDVRIGGK